MKKFLSEFKDFATRGNAIELAVGVVIGSSFGAIVNSLVADIISPLISVITAGVDFSNLRILLKAGTADTAIYLNFGNFIQASITFVITALAIFSMITVLNKMNRKQEEPEEDVVEEVNEELLLLQRIADSLENNKKND